MIDVASSFDNLDRCLETIRPKELSQRTYTISILICKKTQKRGSADYAQILIYYIALTCSVGSSQRAGFGRPERDHAKGIMHAQETFRVFVGNGTAHLS
ncbi:MAG: hypothetical protein DME76_03430 [Verrucomicrobia bacterium]|nr:MAG: hypothetical protein DME76_03430 [Verrucomicrobiota bacterium]